MKFIKPLLGLAIVLGPMYSVGQSSIEIRFKSLRHSNQAPISSLIGEGSPSNFLNDFISDVGRYEIMKASKVNFVSQHIKVCTTNLANAELWPQVVASIVPAQHVAILVDNMSEFTDGNSLKFEKYVDRGALPVCHPVPVRHGKTDSQFIERVRCIGKEYQKFFQYRFFDYNCGGFVRDVIIAAGGIFPIMPNAGIGSLYPGPGFLTDKTQIRLSKQLLFEQIAPQCWNSFPN